MIEYRYKYNGPVLEFDHLICSKWDGETTAKTKEKALSNLEYQFKKKYDRAATAKITLLPKYIKKVETIMK